MGTAGTTAGTRGWGLATTGVTGTMAKQERQGSFPDVEACVAETQATSFVEVNAPSNDRGDSLLPHGPGITSVLHWDFPQADSCKLPKNYVFCSPKGLHSL